MTPAIRKTVVALLVVVYIAAGFFREYLFVNINEQRRVTYDLVYRHYQGESHVSPSMQWLGGYSYETLTLLRWPLTLVFTVLFAFLAARTIRVAFGEKSLVRITWLAYAAVFGVAFLIFAVGWLTGNSAQWHDMARFVAGIAESPALLAILLASFLALRRKQETNYEETNYE